MHRLFVGLRPPPHIRQRLIALMGGIIGARWQSDAQLHLTLRFIGDVETPVAEDVALALAHIRHAPIQVMLDGVGQFERRGRTDAVWAGVRPHEALTAIHRKIDQALVRTGLEPEHRAYLPHITLARFTGIPTSTARFLAEHAALTSEPFGIEHFILFESHLGHGAASYDAIERYPLA